jgi:hypothetical protein
MVRGASSERAISTGSPVARTVNDLGILVDASGDEAPDPQNKM